MTRHRLDVFSLLAGLFFTAVAVLSLTGGWSLSVGPWVWPTVLIGAGVVVLLALLSAARERDDADALVAATTDLLDDPANVEDLIAPHHIAEARAEVEAADPFTDTVPIEVSSDDDA